MKTIHVVAAVIFRTVDFQPAHEEPAKATHEVTDQPAPKEADKAAHEVTDQVAHQHEPKTERQVFATQRGYGEYKDWWEFPGGKIEEGETADQALVREIHEELDTEISVGKKLGTIEYDYPTFHLSMDCFECSVVSGKLTLLEHENSAWLTKDTLRSVEWLPADLTILDSVESLL